MFNLFIADVKTKDFEFNGSSIPQISFPFNLFVNGTLICLRRFQTPELCHTSKNLVILHDFSCFLVTNHEHVLSFLNIYFEINFFINGH